MDFGDMEREFLEAMRAITINERGEEVYVGLTLAESIEFLALTRRDESGFGLPDAERRRFLELRERHEAARQEIVEGRAPLHP